MVSAGATFLTQKQVARNATTAPTGQQATIQRVMLYFIPLSVLVSGVIFPLGVLFYWFTSNLWTMGQQFYIYRYHPTDDEPIAAPVGGGRAGAGPAARSQADPRERPAAADRRGSRRGSPPSGQAARETVRARPTGTTKPGAARPRAAPPGSSQAANGPVSARRGNQPARPNVPGRNASGAEPAVPPTIMLARHPMTTDDLDHCRRARARRDWPAVRTTRDTSG